MTKPASTRSRLSPPASLTAIALLLAACGGGGGGDDSRSVSASPASSNATVSVDTSTAASAASNANAATSSSQTGSAGNATNTGSPGNAGDTANTASAPAANAPNNGSGTPQSDNIPPAPTEPGTGGTSAPDNSTPSPSQPGSNGTTDTPQTTPGTDTVDADSKTSGAPIPTPVPLISAEGVRGDVVLAIMDQNGCSSPYSDRTSAPLGEELSRDNGKDTVDTEDGAKFNVNSYTEDWSKWQGGFPARAPGWFICAQRAVRSYSNPIEPGQYTFRVSARPMYLVWTSPLWGEPWIKKGFNSSAVIYDVTVTNESVSFGTSIKVEQQEDLAYLASSQSTVQPGRTVDTSFTGETYSFQRNALVPFGTLNQWQDGAGNRVRLLVIAGDTPDEARVCTETHTDLVKRLQCKSWRIPENWSWGQELSSPKRYIVDDRSVYPNESGFLYWSRQMDY